MPRVGAATQGGVDHVVEAHAVHVGAGAAVRAAGGLGVARQQAQGAEDAQLAQPGVADRKFLEIDVDNFDDRMRAIKPRAAFRVENTLTGDGQLNVDLTFENMDDFSPEAVARKVDALSQLLDARTQLQNLITYMDGKTGAEELIAKAMNDPELMKSLVSAPKPDDSEQGED